MNANTAEKLGKFGHHPDPAIDAEVEVERLDGLLQDARNGLLRALDYQAVTPSGLSIKADVRSALDVIGWEHKPR